jgi:hypothetical protein
MKLTAELTSAKTTSGHCADNLLGGDKGRRDRIDVPRPTHENYDQWCAKRILHCAMEAGSRTAARQERNRRDLLTGCPWLASIAAIDILI